MTDFTKTQEPASRITLDTPVRYLKGIGPRRAEMLSKLNIETLGDLINQPPRAWEDRRLERPEAPDRLKEFIHRQGAVYVCQVTGVRESQSASGTISILKAQAEIFAPKSNGEKIRMTLSWIRRRSFRYDAMQTLRAHVRPGAALLVFGRWEENAGLREFHVEDYLEAGLSLLTQASHPELDSPHWLRLAPIYPATEGVHQHQLRQYRWDALRAAGSQIPAWSWNALPAGLNLEKGLMPVEEAMRAIHFPPNEEALWLAKKTLAAWELFHLSLAMELRRLRIRSSSKPHHYMEGPGELFKHTLDRLGFALTASQKTAIQEILTDLREKRPMNRLLQGEVGSGKTAVAMAAICLALESGHQAAFVAPTEILVFQHLLTFQKYLAPLGVTMAVLTSDTNAQNRAEILSKAASGEIQILLGTHALLGPDLHFKSLALVIIDEQHRFGVKQRWTLRHKARNPDCLVISATPIPRTLALALYGDLDITTMEELPQGRRIAKTEILPDENEAWKRLASRLNQGFQAYVVVPAIEEENAAYTLRKETKRIQGLFPQYSVAALHGRMGARQKEEVLSGFASGLHAILVATTVIEVGIDVPQAAIMVILSAERYGLATLHQLRGRVGRGETPGECLLVASPGPASGEDLFAQNQVSERLSQFAGTQSGFDIGRLDLLTRGPGKLMGLTQHGHWEFEHFDFQHFSDLIAPVRQAAKALAREDPKLAGQPFVKSVLNQKFGSRWRESDVS